MADAQRKAAEKEAMERELRLRAEQQQQQQQQRQLGRPDGHGQGSQQPRRF